MGRGGLVFRRFVLCLPSARTPHPPVRLMATTISSCAADAVCCQRAVAVGWRDLYIAHSCCCTDGLCETGKQEREESDPKETTTTLLVALSILTHCTTTPHYSSRSIFSPLQFLSFLIVLAHFIIAHCSPSLSLRLSSFQGSCNISHAHIHHDLPPYSYPCQRLPA